MAFPCQCNSICHFFPAVFLHRPSHSPRSASFYITLIPDSDKPVFVIHSHKNLLCSLFDSPYPRKADSSARHPDHYWKPEITRHAFLPAFLPDHNISKVFPYSPTNFNTIKTDTKKASTTSKGVHTRFSFPYSNPISPKMNTPPRPPIHRFGYHRSRSPSPCSIR